MNLRTAPVAVAAAAALALGVSACSAQSAPFKPGQTPQPAIPTASAATPTASAATSSATATPAPKAVMTNLCGKQVLFVPDVTIGDCTWTGGVATPDGGQHFLEGDDGSTFPGTVAAAFTKAGYTAEAQNAGTQTVYTGKGWLIHVIAIDKTVSLQFAPMSPDADPSAGTASAKPSAKPSSGSTTAPTDTSSTGADAELDSDGLPYPVSAGLVNLVHVPDYWMLPGKGKIQNLQDSEPGATYDLANYTTDQLINFYRLRTNKNNFKKVSDTVNNGVVTLVFESLSSTVKYRTTITSTPTGVHVEHQTV